MSQEAYENLSNAAAIFAQLDEWAREIAVEEKEIGQHRERIDQWMVIEERANKPPHDGRVRCGRIFTPIGVILSGICVLGLVLMDPSIYAMTGFFGIPPLTISILLWVSYFKDRKKWARDGENAKKEREEYLRSGVTGDIEKRLARVDELKKHCDDYIAQHAEALAFLPENCRDSAAIEDIKMQMDLQAEPSLDEAIRLVSLDREKEQREREAEEAKKQMNAGYTVGDAVVDSVFDSIF